MSARRPARREDVATEALDGELVIFDPVTSALHVLNATATSLYESLDGARTVDELVAAVAAEHLLTTEAVRVEVDALLDALRAQGLLRPGS